MNPNILAEWFRRQGHNVIRTQSSYWVNSGPQVYQAFPFHWQIQPTESELHELLQRHRIIALRYSTPVSTPTGKFSYHVMIEGDEYPLENLAKKARYDVRKGLEYASYERIPLKRLAEEGWTIRHDTLVRQKREGAETQTWWKNLCLGAEGLEGFEAWGVLRDGCLIAGLLAFTCDNCFCIFYQQSFADHLQFGINNALTFVVTDDAIRRPNIKRIFYGLHSLDAPESVDKFKFRMNYIAQPVRQRVVFHPWVRPLLTPKTHALIKWLAKRTGHSTFAKVEGMARFYLEGKLSLDEQYAPEVLQQLPLKTEASE